MRMSRRPVLISAALAVLAAAGTAAGIALASGPAYTQPWCGRVEATLSMSGTEDAYMAALSSEPRTQQLQDDLVAMDADADKLDLNGSLVASGVTGSARRSRRCCGSGQICGRSTASAGCLSPPPVIRGSKRTNEPGSTCDESGLSEEAAHAA